MWEYVGLVRSVVFFTFAFVDALMVFFMLYRLLCFVLLFLLSYAMGCPRQRETRCEYQSDDGRRMEFLFRDSFLAEHSGYSLFIYEKEREGMGERLVFERGSLRESCFLCADDLPSPSSRTPVVVDACGSRWLLFWAEARRTDVVLLNTRLHLIALSVEGGASAEAFCEGRRVDVALTSDACATERMFLVDTVSFATGDSCMQAFLRTRIEEARFLTDYAKLPRGNPLNYVADWGRMNGSRPLSEMERVDCVVYRRPFAPLRPSRSLENGRFKVMAFPFGSLLAYDKRRQLYIAVWASEHLPREDYSASLAWRDGSDCELLFQGFYDKDVYYLNLETGEIDKP